MRASEPPTGEAIVGLVLAGGRGQRMGGADKGLQLWHGAPLVAHAVARLAPQVRDVMVSANRNAHAYAAYAARVLPDADASFAGPLAGILAGLRAAHAAGMPWLAVVPCDAPLLPDDLVGRLAREVVEAGSDGAVVRRDRGDGPRLEPVCCLLSTALAHDLERYLAEGERKVERWVARHATPVDFDRPEDAQAFANVNTLADLQP
ncbi:MAG: molybdenum cofactor guanylyltransferase MobA [Betaproteobacteria bacterium]